MTIRSLAESARAGLEQCRTQPELEEWHVRFLGRKGELTSILRGLKDLTPEERRTTGHTANELRTSLEERFAIRRSEVRDRALLKSIESEWFDTLRPVPDRRGRLHPLSTLQYRVEDIFTAMGFQIMDGPEVEIDENNFGRLNFSADHPARDMQDTYWTEEGFLLRTHTSPVQVRAMSGLEPPFQIIAPGRVFRFEEQDASHENTFHQVEGMLVDRNVSVAHLNHVMKSFLAAVFERDIKIRLRPGYFPFVEPGFELDISCLLCGGSGCRACKGSGWVEFLGCGLVHPNVLRSGGIDPGVWSGFAFGMGLDRLAMMLHGIEDIRHLMSGNLRFLEQFQS